MNTEHKPRKTSYAMSCRTKVSAGTCAEDLNACVKSGDADSPACGKFVNSSLCCPVMGNR